MGNEFTDLIIPAFVVLMTGIGIVTAWIWNSRLRRDKQVMDKKTIELNIETTAREKQKEEQQLARDLKEHNEIVARGVKQDMRDHIDSLINILNKNMELERYRIYSKIEKLDMVVLQDKIDLAEFIKRQENVNEKQAKALEFLQTMAWGPDAKSIPPYMFGEEQSQEHKDEPDTGAFREQTSEEQTKQTDENDERIKGGGGLNN